MGDKISRRSFLKGTGKTILTAGALSSGIGISTSTTPVKTVIPKATSLNVLSPKAKAYRSYLKGIRALGGNITAGTLSLDTNNWQMFKGELRRKVGNIITKNRIGTGKTQAIAGQSPARQSFEDATKKQRVVNVQGRRIPAKELRSTMNTSANNVAYQIAPDPQAKTPPSERTKSIWRTNQKEIASDLTKSARRELARELREQRRLNKKMKTKSKGAKVGGGGKMALPGLESAKNPTGMSLVTQRYTL